MINIILTSWYLRIKRKVFLQILHCIRIILNRFQHPSQEGLLERISLKMIPCHKTRAKSSVYQKSSILFLNLNPKWRECFYLELHKFYPCNFAQKEGGRGLTKLYTRRLCPKVNMLAILHSLTSRKGLPFHINVASSLKPLSRIYSRPIAG